MKLTEMLTKPSLNISLEQAVVHLDELFDHTGNISVTQEFIMVYSRLHVLCCNRLTF